jgi:hypothetical protein
LGHENVQTTVRYIHHCLCAISHIRLPSADGKPAARLKSITLSDADRNLLKKIAGNQA